MKSRGLSEESFPRVRSHLRRLRRVRVYSLLLIVNSKKSPKSGMVLYSLEKIFKKAFGLRVLALPGRQFRI